MPCPRVRDGTKHYAPQASYKLQAVSIFPVNQAKLHTCSLKVRGLRRASQTQLSGCVVVGQDGCSGLGR